MSEAGPGGRQEPLDLLAPIGFGPFLDHWFGQRPIVLRGDPTRFEHLLSLAQVEQLVLRHHRDRAGADGAGRPRDRIELSDSFGTTIRPDLFHHTLPLPGGALATLDVAWVAEAIGGGARVTVHAVDELDQALAGVTTMVADGAGRAASMQAVATWAPASNPAAITADHVLILQVVGSRRWSIRGPRPAEPDCYLVGPGEVLYVPARRTVAFDDVGTPALHLAILVSDRPPRPLVEGLLAQLASLEVFREDLPPSSEPAACTEQAHRLRAVWQALLAGADRGNGSR